MNTFFELLNQEPDFAINLQSLEYQFIEAQKRVHPDNCLDDSQAHHQSALINQAYMTLKDPFKRAIYYLSLYGISLDKGGETLHSCEFLMRQMEIRERLESASTSAIKESIYVEIQSEVDRLYQLLSSLLSCQNPEHFLDSLEKAANVLKELRFWLSL